MNANQALMTFLSVGLVIASLVSVRLHECARTVPTLSPVPGS
jgi:hypothetical protein